MGHISGVQCFSGETFWGRRPFGMPRRKWEDNIKMGLEEMYCGVGVGCN